MDGDGHDLEVGFFRGRCPVFCPAGGNEKAGIDPDQHNDFWAPQTSVRQYEGRGGHSHPSGDGPPSLEGFLYLRKTGRCQKHEEVH